MKYLTIAATALALSAGAASAATITETTDFSNAFVSTASFGEFSVGTTTVIGSISANCVLAPSQSFADCSASDEIDFGLFSIASGTSVTDATVTISNYVSTGMFNYPVDPLAPPGETGPQPDPSAISGGVNSLSFEDNGVFDLVLNTFSGVGSLSIQAFPSTILSNDPSEPDIQGFGSLAFDYEIAVVVESDGTLAPVPLPAGFPLLAAGLIGLGALARRKKAA